MTARPPAVRAVPRTRDRGPPGTPAGRPAGSGPDRAGVGWLLGAWRLPRSWGGHACRRRTGRRPPTRGVQTPVAPGGPPSSAGSGHAGTAACLPMFRSAVGRCPDATTSVPGRKHLTETHVNEWRALSSSLNTIRDRSGGAYRWPWCPRAVPGPEPFGQRSRTLRWQDRPALATKAVELPAQTGQHVRTVSVVWATSGVRPAPGRRHRPRPATATAAGVSGGADVPRGPDTVPVRAHRRGSSKGRQPEVRLPGATRDDRHRRRRAVEPSSRRAVRGSPRPAHRRRRRSAVACPMGGRGRPHPIETWPGPVRGSLRCRTSTR